MDPDPYSEYKSAKLLNKDSSSAAEPEPPGAATFLRVETEPTFLLAGAKSQKRLF